MRRLLALLLLSACTDSLITDSKSELTVEPAELVFAHGYVGYPAELPLTLVNRGRAPQALEFTVEGPFELLEIPPELSGAASLELQVRFAPAEAGSATGAIRIAHEGGVVAVPLSGSAELPPECGDSECHRGVFDPALGACHQLVLVDGTSCVSRCLDEPTCQQGRCVGKPKSCDDGNVCTADTCDPASGCRNVDTTAQCPKPSNPCRVAICEPKSGCGEVDAADYTPCGAVSCAAANVCFAGVCTEFEPPEGFPCAPETPCRAMGTCKASQCEVPAPGPLPTSWTYAPAEKHWSAKLVFSDPDGNLYLVERTFGSTAGCEFHYPGSPQEIDRCVADIASRRFRLVSLTPEGALRWSQSGAGAINPLFLDHGRLWASIDSTRIEILATADGAAVATINPVSSSPGEFRGGDRIVIELRWLPSSGGVVLTAFDVLSGAQLWQKVISGDGEYISGRPLVLEGDRVMVVLRKALQPQIASEIVLFDAAGNELSRQLETELVPLLLPTRLFPVLEAPESMLTGFDSQTSTFKWQVDYLKGGVSIPSLMVGDAAGLFMPVSYPGTAGNPYDNRLVSRRLSDGGLNWEATLATSSVMNEFWLTSRSSIVIGQNSVPRLLIERRAADGALVYSCPLDAGDDVAVIGNGRAYVNDAGSVKAYAIPKLELSKSGWISRYGNPGRSHRPW